MKVTTNFHTHTPRCLHVGGSDREYIEEAIKNNYKILGFSDHAPYPDNRHGLRMKYNELDEYYASIISFKKEYKDKIEILVGLEIEYASDSINYYKNLLKKFDYLLLGQHISLYNGEFINTYFFTETKDYLIYANSIAAGLNTGYFKILAHPDLIFINKLPFDNNCTKAIEIILNACERNNTILELNANGIRRGLDTYPEGDRYPYPVEVFWREVSKRKLKTIIGVDAHSPHDLGDSCQDKAYDLATSWGLNIVSDFR